MDNYLSALETELQAIITSPDPALDAYYGMFRYHLGWTDAHFAATKTDSGKRIRPLLCLLACQAAGGDWHMALPAAAAIELAHNFSLIHDDIEDNSDERRGRAAVWRVWGLAQGLNAGDGMFVLARLALGRLRECGNSIEKCSAINETFDRATLALCHGQFLDIGFEARLDVTANDYMQMIHGKTAALISAATRIGAMAGCDDPETIEAFARFGEQIGLAFQMTDDILGIWGDSSITGKSAATDLVSKKKSLPAILGLQHPQHGAALQKIYAQPQLAAKDIATALTLLDVAGARDETQQRANQFRATALAALDATHLKNDALDRLRAIAETMTQRIK